MGLDLTFVAGAWLLYAAAAIGLMAMAFAAPRVTPGLFGLGLLLCQQVFGTVAAVLLYTTDSTALEIASFHHGATAWLLWGPLVFLAAPLLMHGSPRARIAWAFAAVGAAPGIAFSAASLLAPGYVFAPGGLALTSWAAASLLFTFVGFACTSAFLAWEAMASPAPIRRMQFTLLSAAFIVEGVFHTAQNVARGTAFRLDFEGIPFLLAAVAFIAFAGILAYVASQRREDPDNAKRATWLLAAILAASLTGAIGSRLIYGDEFRDPTGILHAVWDLAGLAFLIFAGLRYQLFSIELHAKQSLGATVGILVVVGIFVALQEVLSGFLQDSYFAGLPASGVVSGCVVAGVSINAVKFGRGVAARVFPKVDLTPAYERQRKEEVYRAALEGILLDGVVAPAEAKSIQKLREVLEMTMDDHHRLEKVVRAQMAAAA
jgi:hypothetical protein